MPCRAMAVASQPQEQVADGHQHQQRAQVHQRARRACDAVGRGRLRWQGQADPRAAMGLDPQVSGLIRSWRERMGFWWRR